MNPENYYRRVLEDIAKGRWNTGSRFLDTPDNLIANEYARAALRGVAPYVQAGAEDPATLKKGADPSSALS